MRRSVLLLFCALLAPIGCASIEPGDVSGVALPSDTAARSGNVYLIRGFLGIFSTGIDRLGTEISAAGVRASVFQDDQWSNVADAIARKETTSLYHEPLVLVGHSYGADDAIRIARELKKRNVQVDLLITLDPVTPPPVPVNVRQCINLYQSNGVWDTFPWLRGVPVGCERESDATQLINANLRVDRTDLFEPGLDHFNIEKKQKVHDEILQHVLNTCPARSAYATRPLTPVLARPDPGRGTKLAPAART